MNNFDPEFIPAGCKSERCFMCGAQARHKVEEVLFEDDSTAWEPPDREGEDDWGKYPARHPSTAYLCSKCFGKVMGRTTIPGFSTVW